MSYSRSTTMTLGDATAVKHSMGSNKVYCKVTQMVIPIIHHFIMVGTSCIEKKRKDISARETAQIKG